jgi:acylphosphatase
VHLHIRGRVQGVFYRQSALGEATRLGLTGWVRNRREGHVEALAEGPAEKVDAFVKWCWQGPPSAHVEAVELSPAPAGERAARFTVEPTT